MSIHIALTILYICLFFAIFEGKVYAAADDKEKVKIANSSVPYCRKFTLAGYY